MYNEITINRCLSVLPKGCEIIVVDSNNNSTLKLIKALHVKKISSKKGRSFQMNEGARYANGDVLLFLPVDTILPKDALLHVEDALGEADTVAGAFDLAFDSDKKSLQFIAKVASWRSRFTRLPYGDQAIFIKKEIFNEVGGYDKIGLMEDVALMQKLKKQKLNIKILKQKVITSARKYEKNGIIYNVIRNWTLLGLYYLGVNPNRLEKFYK